MIMLVLVFAWGEQEVFSLGTVSYWESIYQASLIMTTVGYGKKRFLREFRETFDFYITYFQ